MRGTVTTRGAATLALTLLLTATTACTGSEEGGGEDASAVLTSAKQQLDETEGVRIRLSTDTLPDGIDGVLGAEGVGTHAPAFEGQITVATGSLSVDVPVVATGGKVYAQLPFQKEFRPIDPAAYTAPDPADLMDPDQGLSSLLTAATKVSEGDQVRAGEQVLTSYTGTLPGDVVANILPSASPESSFDADFLVADDGRLAEVTMTGDFYAKAPELTYRVEFSDYGTSKKITPPSKS